MKWVALWFLIGWAVVKIHVHTTRRWRDRPGLVFVMIILWPVVLVAWLIGFATGTHRMATYTPKVLVVDLKAALKKKRQRRWKR